MNQNINVIYINEMNQLSAEACCGVDCVVYSLRMLSEKFCPAAWHSRWCQNNTSPAKFIICNTQFLVFINAKFIIFTHHPHR